MNLDSIIRAVCVASHELGHRITPADVMGTVRKKEMVRCRHMVMFIARHHYLLTLEGIAKMIGGKDHASVVHAVKMMANAIPRYSEHGRLYMGSLTYLNLQPLDGCEPMLVEKPVMVVKKIKNPVKFKAVGNYERAEDFFVPMNWSAEEKARLDLHRMYPGAAPGAGNIMKAIGRSDDGGKTKLRHFQQALTHGIIRKQMRREK